MRPLLALSRLHLSKFVELPLGGPTARFLAFPRALRRGLLLLLLKDGMRSESGPIHEAIVKGASEEYLIEFSIPGHRL